MIPLVDRDLIRSFILVFVALLIMVQVALFIATLLEYFQFIDTKLGWILLFYIFSIPEQAVYTLPVGTAVSILWVYSTKARNNELLAWMAGGVSPQRLAVPLVVCSLIISVAGLFINEGLAPAGSASAARIERVQIEGRTEAAFTRSESIFQKGGGNRWYSMEAFDVRRELMESPLITERFEDSTQLKWRLDAREAVFQHDGENSGWFFKNAVYREWDREGNPIVFDQYERVTEHQLGIPMEQNLNKFLSKRHDPDEMSITSLWEYINLLEGQGKVTFDLKTDFYFKFMVPLGTFILALLMCGHVLKLSGAGLIMNFGGGIVIMLIYFLLMIGMDRIASVGGFGLPPLAVTSFPNVLALIVGIILLYRQRFA